MASGTITKSLNVAPYDYKLYIEWVSTPDISTNSSLVEATVYFKAGASLNISARSDNLLSIGGNNFVFSTSAIQTSTGTTRKLYSASARINHNTDGTKNIAIAAYFNLNATISGSYFGEISAYKSVALDTIPKKATITSAPNFTDEDNPTIRYSNPAGSAVKVAISLTGATDDIVYRSVSTSGSSYTFNLTDAERAILRNATNSGSNSRTVYFYLRTTLNGTYYYHKVTKTFTVVNAAPTLAPTATDVGGNSTRLTGDPNTIIKYFNYIKVNNGATAYKGATIVSQSVKCGSQTLNSGSGNMANVDSGTFVFTATDSRGNTVTQTLEKGFIAYVPITCNLTISPPTTDGEVTFTIWGNYFSGTFGAESNNLSIQYRYKEESGDYTEWVAIPLIVNHENHTYSLETNLTGFDYRKAWTFQAKAADKVNTVESAEIKVKTTPVFDWSSSDFRFNVPVTFAAGFADDTETSKILWQGNSHMNGEQTIALSQPISEQNKGIVLVFSLYDNAAGAAKDASITTHFVSKEQVELLGSSAGHTFLMAINAGFSSIGAKYLYFSDDSISGNATNTSSGTNSGITFNNANYVLRYVIGV